MMKLRKQEPKRNDHHHPNPYNLSSIINTENQLADLDSDSEDDSSQSMDGSVSSWISNTGKNLFRRSFRMSGNDSDSSSLLDGLAAVQISSANADEAGTRSVSKRLSGSISGLLNNSSSSLGSSSSLLLNGSYSKLGKSLNGSGTMATEDLTEFSFEDEMFNQNSFASVNNKSNNASFNNSFQRGGQRPAIEIEKFEHLFEEEEDTKPQPSQAPSNDTRTIFEGRVRQNVEETLKKIQRRNVPDDTNDTNPDPSATGISRRRRRRSVDVPAKAPGRTPERTTSSRRRRRSVDAPTTRSTSVASTTQDKPVRRERRHSVCKSLDRSCLKSSIATPSRSMQRVRRESQSNQEDSEREKSRSSLLAEGRREFARRANLSASRTSCSTSSRRSSSVSRRRTPTHTASSSSERPRLRRASSPSPRGLAAGPAHRVKKATNGKLPPKLVSR